MPKGIPNMKAKESELRRFEREAKEIVKTDEILPLVYTGAVKYYSAEEIEQYAKERGL